MMVLLGKKTDWATIKKDAFGDFNLIDSLKYYDAEKISPATLKKLGKYLKMDEFNKPDVRKKSAAAG